MQQEAYTNAAGSLCRISPTNIGSPPGQLAVMHNRKAYLEGLQVGSEIHQQALCLLLLEVRLTPDGPVKAGKALCCYVGSLAEDRHHVKHAAAWW